MGEVRRRRKGAADDLVGVREVAPGAWALPAMGIETFLDARRTRGEWRAGFKAWIAERDGGRLHQRAIQDWDRLLAEYSRAPM